MSDPAVSADKIQWRKSSYSSNSSACVEILATSDSVKVRDSADPHGGVLVIDKATWRCFLKDIQGGQVFRPE